MTPETTALIDSIDVTLNAGGMNTINIVLAFVMYGVALGIKPVQDDIVTTFWADCENVGGGAADGKD